MSSERPHFSWVGGAVSLDFVNTVAWVNGTRDRFREYEDVIDWAVEAQMVSESRAADLRQAAADTPETAAATLALAHTARRTMHEVLAAVGAGVAPSPRSLEQLTRHIHAAFAAVRLGSTPVAAGLAQSSSRASTPLAPFAITRTWGRSATDLSQLLWPVIADVYALLTDARREQLRLCGNDKCGWVFLDTSRNGMRRWCDMRVCGNRVKSRRRYARDRDARASAESDLSSSA